MRYYVRVLNRGALFTLVAAVLFPVALPNEIFPFGNVVVGVLALSPYYLAMREAATPREAVRLGALFGGVSTILGNYWLMFFGEFSFWTIGGTTLGYVAYNAVLAGYLWRVSQTKSAYAPVLFALTWTLYEYLKSIGFLAYPWGLAAYPFSEITVLMQIADVTGVWGITLIAVYVNVAIAELLVPDRADFAPAWRPHHAGHLASARRVPVRHAAMAVLLVCIAVAYGVIRLRTEIRADTSLELLLVQQNTDAWNARDIAKPLLITQNETEAAITGANREPDLIVWSETSLRYFYDGQHDWYARNPRERPFVEFVRDLPAPLLTGAPMQNPQDDFAIHNAVLLIDQDTTVRQWYGKKHLVPFAEVIPFWNTPVVQRFFRTIVGIPGIWTPGPGIRLFTISDADGRPVTFATPVCFEDAFAYLNRAFVLAGADLLINLTNNSWSRTNSAQVQHFVAARFRAIESRRSLVRSTNSGYTTIVDPWGRVTASTPMFLTTHLNVTVPVYRPERETVYTSYGDWLPQLFAVFALVLVCKEIVPKKRGATGAPLVPNTRKSAR